MGGLTAKDRTPQIGDVLTMQSNVLTTSPRKVASIYIARDGEVQWQDEFLSGTGAWYSCGEWWLYVSRADSGSIEKEKSSE